MLGNLRRFCWKWEDSEYVKRYKMTINLVWFLINKNSAWIGKTTIWTGQLFYRFFTHFSVLNINGVFAISLLLIKAGFFHFVRWDWKDAHQCDTKLNKLCKFCDQIHCKNVFIIIPMQFKLQLCMKNGIASKNKFMLDGSFTNIIKYLVTTIYYSAIYSRLILSQWEICSVCVWLKIM